MKILSDVTTYEYDGEDVCRISITARQDDYELFEFNPENSGDCDDWKQMMIACEQDNSEYYSCDGGDCQITVGKKFASFEISRRGDGYGGVLSIQIPKKLCVDAFRNIYQTMESIKIK
jgi:hypothetical protein